MCNACVMEQSLASLSRRDLMGLASTALATGVLAEAVPATAQNRRNPSLPAMIPTRRVHDLTHPLSPSFPIIPIPGLTFPFRISEVASVAKNGVYSNKWELIEHNGTHIDAPSHFIAGQFDLDQFAPVNFVCPIAIIDVTERATQNRDLEITPDDILAWETMHGRLPGNAAVFMRSGWDRKVATADAFIGMDASGTMHFPGFSAETCAFLVQERDIAGVGVDTISFDPGFDKDFNAHKALFRGGKWGIECLANLDQVPASGAIAVIGMPKVKGASGSPCRVYAFTR
jgi:kynurenine formamidase